MEHFLLRVSVHVFFASAGSECQSVRLTFRVCDVIVGAIACLIRWVNACRCLARFAPTIVTLLLGHVTLLVPRVGGCLAFLSGWLIRGLVVVCVEWLRREALDDVAAHGRGCGGRGVVFLFSPSICRLVLSLCWLVLSLCRVRPSFGWFHRSPLRLFLGPYVSGPKG